MHSSPQPRTGLLSLLRRNRGTRRRGRARALFLWSVLGVMAMPGAATATDPLQELVSAAALRCEFPSGRVTRWEGGRPVNGSDRFQGTITVEDIDHDLGMARLHGDAGSTEVVIVASVLGVTFLEGTEAGNLNVITVYPYRPDPDTPGDQPRFAAVMSRHVMINGNPVPSQHVGHCRPPG